MKDSSLFSLFSGTLRYNLDPLKKFSDEELCDIMEKICLKEVFESRKGLESEVLNSILFFNLNVFNFRFQKMVEI